MRYQNLLFVLIFLITSCSNKPLVAQNATSPSKGELVGIDYKDDGYNGFRSSMGDTTTKSGWKIEYLVKNDTTKYQDLYIRCSKGNLKNVFAVPNVFTYRSYFVPTFEGENEDCLFFSHGCSSTCGAVLIFNKKDLIFKDYAHLVQFDIENSAVVYIPDQEGYVPLKLKVVDLKKGKEMDVNFKNRCMASVSFKTACIDTVIFSKEKVTIKANLIDVKDDYREKEIKEEQTVKR